MPIVEAIRAAARERPSYPAIVSQRGVIAYAELLERVDGLASDLRSFGIRPGNRIAIALERSPEMVIAILATISAGGAYVPLETDYPGERLRQVVLDARLALALAAGPCAGMFDGLHVHPVPNWSRSGPRCDANAKGPAYLIYTSGSTGQPKGVVIEHAALENYLDWACRTLPRGEVPLLSSMAFDLAVTSFYPPLMRGDPLYLVPPLRGGRDLAEGLLNGRPFGYVKITPSHCRLLSREQRAALGRAASLVMFGGERLAGDLVRHVRAENPGLAVINHYGPTEATVGCCAYAVPTDFGSDDIVPIGSPLPGVLAALRAGDRWIEGEGEVGELWIGGRGLAKGYWNGPAMTKAAFVRVGEKGGRWYRTGDLARRDASGAYVHCGRLDHQVKILGHRVEPREVEIALAAYPGVSDCAVLTEAGPDMVRIVAAVAASRPGPSEQELLDHLRSRLPGAMIPSRIVVFELLPILVTGKLDRDGIIRAAREGPSQDIAAASRLEVGRQFGHALGLDAVDDDADFFDLGGDSLAALEITTWANRAFGLDLELSVMFECATVRSLTERIAQAQQGGARNPA